MFEWYMARLGVKKGHQNPMFDNKVVLCAL